MEFKLIGGEVWLDGHRVAILTRDAPPSLQQLVRDRLEHVSFDIAESLLMKEARDDRSR